MSNGSLLSKEHVDFVEYVSGNHLQLNIIMEVKQRGTPQFTLRPVFIILCKDHCLIISPHHFVNQDFFGGGSKQRFLSSFRDLGHTEGEGQGGSRHLEPSQGEQQHHF